MIEAASPWVTDLRVVDHRYQNGDRKIAVFSVVVRGMSIRDLELVRTAKGGFRAVSPAISRRTGREAIQFHDDALRHALMNAALRVYRDNGGQHGAYAGQSDE